MGKTRIFVTTDAGVAAETLGAWKNKPGYKTMGIGPTDTIVVSKAEDDSQLWQSTGASPWYAVVATKDSV